MGGGQLFLCYDGSGLNLVLVATRLVGSETRVDTQQN
jgi:hypothetical protein